jgi:hypothetical protein
MCSHFRNKKWYFLNLPYKIGRHPHMFLAYKKKLYFCRFLKMGDPQVTMGFNTNSWSSMTWMIWGSPMTKRKPPGIYDHTSWDGICKSPNPYGVFNMYDILYVLKKTVSIYIYTYLYIYKILILSYTLYDIVKVYPPKLWSFAHVASDRGVRNPSETRAPAHIRNLLLTVVHRPGTLCSWEKWYRHSYGNKGVTTTGLV